MVAEVTMVTTAGTMVAEVTMVTVGTTEVSMVTSRTNLSLLYLSEQV